MWILPKHSRNEFLHMTRPVRLGVPKGHRSVARTFVPEAPCTSHERHLTARQPHLIRFWHVLAEIPQDSNSMQFLCFDIAEATESQDSLRTINLRHCRAGVNTLEMCVELLGGASSMTGSRQRLEFCGWFCSSQSHLVLHNLAYFGRRVVLDY
jgi:hypothetical protein